MTSRRPNLYVEVRLKRDNRIATLRDIEETVSRCLIDQFIHLTINQNVFIEDPLACHIDSIQVAEFDGESKGSTSHRINNVHLNVQVYELCDENGILSSQVLAATPSTDDDEEIPFGKLQMTELPSKSLVGVWESLVFEDAIPTRLLRLTSRMITVFSRYKELDTTLINCNRLILLHGPPGTGKTTLCRALAQKLSIRLGSHFSSSLLVEINAQSLMSKWFSESGKLVERMFEQISGMALDESKLICILIDEVETIAGSREKASAETGDALRATNQFLTALDRMRYRTNVVLFATSNLIDAVDSAFLDRIDLKQFVPNPTPRASYEIFRSCLNEFVRCGMITTPFSSKDGADTTMTTAKEDYLDLLVPVQDTTLELYFPVIEKVEFLGHDSPQDILARKLRDIANQSSGLSGRALRRLPLQALALYTYSDPCPIGEALTALDTAVKAELGGT